MAEFKIKNEEQHRRLKQQAYKLKWARMSPVERSIHLFKEKITRRIKSIKRMQDEIADMEIAIAALENRHTSTNIDVVIEIPDEKRNA